MALYMITSKHEPEQCLRALDEIQAKGGLDKFVYGCKEGDHTGYAIVDVEDEKEARALVPDSLEESSCIAKVDRFTAEELESLHKKAA